MADQQNNRRLGRALTGTAAVVLVATAVSVPQEPLKASATIKEVMAALTVPSSEVIFAAASEPPTNDLHWVAVRDSAIALAESGKLLMTGGRTGDDIWMAMSRVLVTQAHAAQTAAEARNSAELSKASDDVYETCKVCHASYMNP